MDRSKVTGCPPSPGFSPESIRWGEAYVEMKNDIHLAFFRMLLPYKEIHSDYGPNPAAGAC